jgi:hypothetical protein
MERGSGELGGGQGEGAANPLDDGIEFVMHLVPGCSRNPVAAGDQDLVAPSILPECDRSAVSSFAVGFDHDSPLLPEEVDHER